MAVPLGRRTAWLARWALSLVILTSALARELGLQLRYQDMQTQVWERHGEQGLELNIGHVNILISEARDWAQAVVRLRPENPLTLYESGRQAMGRGDWETARRHLMRALALGGDWHELHCMLAQACAQQGLGQEAERHLELARESGPTLALRRRYGLKLARLRQSSSGAEQPSRQ